MYVADLYNYICIFTNPTIIRIFLKVYKTGQNYCLIVIAIHLFFIVYLNKRYIFDSIEQYGGIVEFDNLHVIFNKQAYFRG